MEMSVSIVTAPWRALTSAARWKSKPAQNTTGVASASASHSQPTNWRGVTIASTTSGEDSAAATTSLRRTASTRSTTSRVSEASAA